MKRQDRVRPRVPAMGRREVMKLGAGVVMTTLNRPKLSAQEGGEGGGAREGRAPVERPAGVKAVTGTGYKNDANRVYGNGPMDETSRRLASYTRNFAESQLSDPALYAGISNTMLDTITALVAGFDSDAARICARLAKQNQSDLKATVSGYGIVTSPESAAFANSFMVRNCDYNDGDPEHGGHASVIIPGILAVGEALHSTGTQVMAAVAIGYEALHAFARSARAGGWDAPYEGLATALGCGRLMGLDEDRLANAISLALVPHMPLSVSHVGALSFWKSGHSPMGVRTGVLAALLAKEGMTGPAQPFEERSGLMDKVTGPFDLRIPVNPNGPLGIQNFRTKRYPVEGNAQAMMHQAIPPIRQFAKAEDIASVHVEMAFGSWQEIADPPKWDPRNRETADHSLPYLLAVALTEGEVYLDAFMNDRYIKDTKLRDLMAKITAEPNPEMERPQGKCRITVRKKSGEVMTKDVLQEIPITHADTQAKFDRVCKFMSVPNDQRDRARAAWTDLKSVKDIAEPLKVLAHFGRPLTI